MVDGGCSMVDGMLRAQGFMAYGVLRDGYSLMVQREIHDWVQQSSNACRIQCAIRVFNAKKVRAQHHPSLSATPSEFACRAQHNPSCLVGYAHFEKKKIEIHPNFHIECAHLPKHARLSARSA